MFRDDGGIFIIEPWDDLGACAEALSAEDDAEFALYPFLDADSVEAAAIARFMPMGLTLPTPEGVRDFLLPKLHLERCLLDPRDARVTRTARRESRRFSLSVNRAFGPVLDACVLTHGADWLVPGLVDAFKALHGQRAERRAAMLSVELWREGSDGELAAGEIGYLIGSAYASLTGFCSVSGAGTVQLAALGRLLAGLGVGVWDLGMAMDYKLALGARPLPRRRFLPLLARAYADDASPIRDALLAEHLAVSARDLIDSHPRAPVEPCEDEEKGGYYRSI